MNCVILKTTAKHFIPNKLSLTSALPNVILNDSPKLFPNQLTCNKPNTSCKTLDKFRHRLCIFDPNSLNALMMKSVIFKITTNALKVVLNDLTRLKLSLSGKPLEKFRHRLRLFAPNSLNVLIMDSVILKITANHFIPNKLSPTSTPLKVILNDLTLHKLSLT
ncbi:hypothetical protein FOZ63_012092 [Perkinsus olseni]|uniref:Uncharacterized protein n=1 Tax=Perkinsus olseni TaxID=32597 RepID=A0A7J6R3C7_PEROL|nr:hypothetical protein FOZ63_012092 [Perkinsus olseni]KAF4756282.1 hypothetical protein FOZ62_001609 [Perkinsus olseni]